MEHIQEHWDRYATGNAGDMYEDDDDFFDTWQYEVNAYNVVYSTMNCLRRELCNKVLKITSWHNAKRLRNIQNSLAVGWVLCPIPMILNIGHSVNHQELCCEFMRIQLEEDAYYLTAECVSKSYARSLDFSNWSDYNIQRHIDNLCKNEE